jgi:hypothetical protein
MDLVPAPTEPSEALKSPVVKVETVDMAADGAVAQDPEISSEWDTDSDDSDAWETLSNADDAIQLLRDDQLRDGLGMFCVSFPCTPSFSRPRRSGGDLIRNPLPS